MSSSEFDLVFRQAREAAAGAMESFGDEAIFTPEQVILPPDLSQGMPDKLWQQLGMSPGMRDKIVPEAFHLSRTQPLIIRTDAMVDTRLENLLHSNEALLLEMLDVLEHTGDQMKQDAAGNDFVNRALDTTNFHYLVVGSMLALEAYQVETGKDLIQGLSGLTSESDPLASYREQLPDPDWWYLNRVRQVVKLPKPDERDQGIITDAKQIARYSGRYVLPMGIGAQAMSAFMRTHWSEVYSDGLPPYTPSPYASDGNPLG